MAAETIAALAARIEDLARDPRSLAALIKTERHDALLERMTGDFSRAGRTVASISDEELRLRLDYFSRMHPGEIFRDAPARPHKPLSEMSSRELHALANGEGKAKL